MDPLDKYRQYAKTLSSDAFVGEFPSPVLVARQIIGGRLMRKEKSGSRGRQTTHIHVDGKRVRNPRQDEVLVTRNVEAELCAQLRKSPHTPPEEAISIGRVAENDVVISDYAVSKRHATFVIDPVLGSYGLTDHGSTNGTFVNDRRLEPEQPCHLRSGSWVTFGRLVFLFLTAHDFYRYLNGMQPPEMMVEVSFG